MGKNKCIGIILITPLLINVLSGCRLGGLHERFSPHQKPYTSIAEYTEDIMKNRTSIYKLEKQINQNKDIKKVLEGLKYLDETVNSCSIQRFKNCTSIASTYKSICEQEELLEQKYSETYHIESSLRKKAIPLLKDIEDLRTVLGTYTGVERRNNLYREIKSKERDIGKIRRTISFSGNDYMKTYDDYEDIFSRFYVGYEYVSANHLFEKGYPLLGMGLFARMVEDKKPDGYYGWDFYGIHSGLSAQLTSLDEQDAKFTNTTSVKTSVKLGESRSLSFEVPVFIPLYRSSTVNGGKHWFYIGPTGSLRGIMTDEEERFEVSYYGGIRFAGNPETYGDILVGRSESLRSSRFDMRFQMPLPVLKESTGENTSFFLGGAINLGMGESRKKEADFFKAYVIWNVDVWNILTKQTSSSK